MLRKGVYPYEYTGRFNETSLPKKKEFYSSLAMEDITDTDYKTHRKGPEDLKIQNVGVYHDLCEQSDRL